MLKTKTQKSED